MDLNLRAMRKRDLKQVLEIEQESFPSPWRRGMFVRELRKRNASYIVAEKLCSDRTILIVGYGGLWWLPLREAHITNLAVDKVFRRQGVGRRLLEELVERAGAKRIHTITLEVRKSNLAARRLYESFGFSACGVRKNYYRDRGEDAVIMSRPLASQYQLR